MKIACLLESWFEDAEFKEPYDAFTAAAIRSPSSGWRQAKR